MSGKIWIIDQIVDGKRERTLLTQEAVDLARNRVKEKRGATAMPTSNVIAKITVEFKDGTVTVVTPGSGHSIIIAFDCGDRIAQVTAGKRPVLAKLFTAIVQQTPEFIPFASAVAMKRRLVGISDANFNELPIGGTA